MAKTRAPLLSFGARGQIGKTAVYSSWRGVGYVRERVIPANPRTAAQQANRSIFGNMRALWKIWPASAQAPWNAFATGRQFTGMNAFLGQNNRALQGASDLASFIASPGARGGFPMQSFLASPGAGSGEIDVSISGPTLPAGWAITAAHAVAVADFDPTDVPPDLVEYETAIAAPYDMTFTGLTGGQTYAVGGYIEYTKPNGQTAYSVSEVSLVAATA